MTDSTEECECPICHGEFKAEGAAQPRVITCGHSLCTDCLHNLSVARTGSSYKCPVCREPILLNSHNKPGNINFALVDRLRKLESQRAAAAAPSQVAVVAPAAAAPSATFPAPSAVMQPITASAQVAAAPAGQTAAVRAVTAFAAAAPPPPGADAQAVPPAAVMPLLPAPSLLGAFVNVAARIAATDCIHATPSGMCGGTQGGVCGYRHRVPISGPSGGIAGGGESYCPDWCLWRFSAGSQFCPRGAGCPKPHPHRRVVALTDCPASVSHRRGVGTACAAQRCNYTGGLPCALRHADGASNAVCLPWTQGHCPAGIACGQLHLWKR